MAAPLDLTALAGATLAFDLDGTLVDTAPDLVGTLNVILQEEGHAPLPLAEARPFIGKGARWLLQRGFTEAGAPISDDAMGGLFERFIVRYNAHIADESAPFPGMVETLGALREAGARLVVCTNKRTDLSTNLLDALKLSSLFEAIVGADAAPAQKPDRRHLETAIARAGGRPDRAVMIGDAAPDAGAARAAGVPLVLVSFGYTEVPVADLGADILIDHYGELPGACLQLLAACRRPNEAL
ncbi:HAD-IA family hydrolase [Phenylobacterium sp.]|uniref:HAD-IA family hydrolase n=1 Tax=Phenylobacterium sp. TaxID=1871053 RepID=UPI0027316405|nr:HAD-IA family hydrolase [Phenylobacterium sp.]MDP2212319.1 HAD-IA family hydrolase [Phenylobacterium sp.]